MSSPRMLQKLREKFTKSNKKLKDDETTKKDRLLKRKYECMLDD